MKFGTSERPPINAGLGQASPGAKYAISAINEAPGYSFGPLNSRTEGRLRNRADEASNVTKLYLGSSMSANAEMKNTPAPGAYDHHSTLTASAAFIRQPTLRIQQASRETAAKVTSAYLLAEMPVTSPRKLFIFVI